MGMGLRISRAVLETALAHAATDPAREACGLLLGAAEGGAERIAEARACANVAADPARRFEIDPAALFAAIRAERGGGPRLLGHYHSHPNGSARPSPQDAAMADRPGRLWLILAGGEARFWRETPGGSVHAAFEPCSISVEDGCA
jgi:desampylase